MGADKSGSRNRGTTGVNVTITLQNLQDGAGGGRWPLLAERLAPAGTDVLVITEAAGWAADECAQARRAAADLGLTALDLPPSRSGYHVGLLYRRETLGDPVGYCTDLSAEVTHGCCVAAWDVGLPEPLAVTAGHFSPFSTVDALRDAELTGWTAQRYGRYAVIGTDANQQPEDEMPDLGSMSRADIARRFTDPLADPPRVPRTDVARALAADGFRDAAVRLRELTGDEKTWRARTGRSGRIDWILISQALLPAVTAGQLLTTPPGAANHHGLSITIDTALAS